MPASDGNSVLVSGVVSLFQIHVQNPYIGRDDEEDDFLYGQALEMQQKLRREIEEQVHETLGPEFQVQSLDIRKGSVTFLIAISAAYAFYMSFSRYESFVKSANLLTVQLKGIVQRIFGQNGNAPGNLDVQGTWVPLSPITDAHTVLSPTPKGWDNCRLLLLYILVSHALLLSLVAWLLITRLK
jgi:hypothetical protein